MATLTLRGKLYEQGFDWRQWAVVHRKEQLVFESGALEGDRLGTEGFRIERTIEKSSEQRREEKGWNKGNPLDQRNFLHRNITWHSIYQSAPGIFFVQTVWDTFILDQSKWMLAHSYQNIGASLARRIVARAWRRKIWREAKIDNLHKERDNLSVLKQEFCSAADKERILAHLKLDDESIVIRKREALLAFEWKLKATGDDLLSFNVPTRSDDID